MIDKKTVFILGAGASCPYGYPSGARLRKSICLDQEFMQNYIGYLSKNKVDQTAVIRREVQQFKDAFTKSSIKSIDIFMANNPKLAPIGKYIIAFEVFSAEQKSRFREEARLWQELSKNPPESWTKTDCILRREDFQGDDWYSYLYNRLIEGLVGKEALPDFSDGKIAFITFNYDRSLEHFLHESLYNSFMEVLDDRIVQYFEKMNIPVATGQVGQQNRDLLIQVVMEQLKILHVYGQIMPLRWQDSYDGVDYRPEKIDEALLQKAANNIKTIYEQKSSPEIQEARRLLSQSEQIFFLGFGYAPENMDLLGLPGIISPVNRGVYGTAFGLKDIEVRRISGRIVTGLQPDHIGFKNSDRVIVETVDCLDLLRNHLS